MPEVRQDVSNPEEPRRRAVLFRRRPQVSPRFRRTTTEAFLRFCLVGNGQATPSATIAAIPAIPGGNLGRETNVPSQIVIHRGIPPATP